MHWPFSFIEINLQDQEHVQRGNLLMGKCPTQKIGELSGEVCPQGNVLHSLFCVTLLLLMLQKQLFLLCFLKKVQSLKQHNSQSPNSKKIWLTDLVTKLKRIISSISSEIQPKILLDSRSNNRHICAQFSSQSLAHISKVNQTSWKHYRGSTLFHILNYYSKTR